MAVRNLTKWLYHLFQLLCVREMRRERGKREGERERERERKEKKDISTLDVSLSR